MPKRGKKYLKSIKDADAMLFHIYATAVKDGRNLNKNEEQQVVDINAGKTRLIAQMVQPFKRCVDPKGGSKGDPIIREEIGKAGVYEQDGSKVDEFKSCAEAKANYPEGEIENA